LLYVLIACFHCWDSRKLSQELLREFLLYILIFCVLCSDSGKLSEELIEAVFFFCGNFCWTTGLSIGHEPHFDQCGWKEIHLQLKTFLED
jgi:hypothetical protein